MVIDPNGCEGYEIDQKTGKISQVNETKYYRAKDGNVTPVNKGDTYQGNDPEVDQVMNSKGNYTYVTHGVMGEKQNIQGKQMFQFGDSKEAVSFYYFASESSNAEWAFADMKSGYGMVGTEGSSANTAVPSYFENNYGADIKLLSHSHTGSGGPPSVTVWNGNKEISGDLINARDSQYSFQREVYDVPNKIIYQYSKSTYSTWLDSGKRKSWDCQPIRMGR